MTSHLIQARVEVLAGTDVVKPFFIPGVSLHDELTLLVRAGMSNMQALQAATVKPASFLGIRQLGTIESRKIADMVLLDANPLEDISNTRKIASVTVGGRFHDRSALDRMLAQVERDATAWKGTPTPSAGRQRRQH